MHAERGVLVGERAERLAQLVLVGLRLRFDRDRDDGLGEDHLLEDDRVGAVAERVAGGRLLEAETRDDVARVRDLDVLALVRVHAQDAPDALLAILGGVVDLRTLLELARVDPEVRELAVGVGDDLERERANGSFSLALRSTGSPFMSMPSVGLMSIGAGRKSTTASSMGCTPLFLNAEPHSTGTNSNAKRSGADRGLDLVDGQVLAFEVLLHQVIVDVRDRLEQLVARRVGGVGVFGGDVDDLELGAFGVVVERPDRRPSSRRGR